MRNFFQVFEGNFRIIHFATTESDGYFHFHPVFQPATCISHFEGAMVLIRLWPQPDFLHLNFGLSFLCLAFFLCSFIDELSKIHHTANGRVSVGRDLDQVEFGVAGKFQGFLDGHYTDVVPVGTNQADFRNTDAFIYSKFVGADMLLLLTIQQTASLWLAFSRTDDTMNVGESSTKRRICETHFSVEYGLPL